MFTIFNVINITNHLSKKFKKTSKNFKTLKNKRPMRRAKNKEGMGQAFVRGPRSSIHLIQLITALTQFWSIRIFFFWCIFFSIGL